MNITVAPSTSTARHRSPAFARRTAPWTCVCNRLVVPGVMRRAVGARALDGDLLSSARAMATRWLLAGAVRVPSAWWDGVRTRGRSSA
jgi:hypothetical protein